MTRRQHRWGACLLLFFLASPEAARAAGTAPGGAPAVAQGWIVFDSNRAGQFDIWKMRPDGGSVTRLTDDPAHDMYPDWSPDGRRIVFARHPARDPGEPGEIILMDADGKNPRRVAGNGTFPTFTADGAGVIFERNRRLVMLLDLSSGKERRLLPPPGTAFGGEIVKPRLSPDGRAAVFTSDKRGKWHVWRMGLDGKADEVAGGCEGVWDPGGTKIWYVSGSQETGTGVFCVDIPAGRPVKVPSIEGSPRNVYFPSVSPDGKQLLFGACPSSQRNHFTANYQIYLRNLERGGTVRLTANAFTDRWPKLSLTAR